MSKIKYLCQYKKCLNEIPYIPNLNERYNYCTKHCLHLRLHKNKNGIYQCNDCKVEIFLNAKDNKNHNIIIFGKTGSGKKTKI